MQRLSFDRHRFPPEVIRYAVWLYARFTLSYRDMAELLAERGLDISYETVRQWCLKFGPSVARNLRRKRPTPSDHWHMDEMVIAIRGHMAEFGIAAPQGARRVGELIERVQHEECIGVPQVARRAVLALAIHLERLEQEINALERELSSWQRSSAASQRLATIPGIGVITATALAASVPDSGAFKSGRQFAAFLGSVPRQNSTGGKSRLGRISKMGTATCTNYLLSERHLSCVARGMASAAPRRGCMTCSNVNRHVPLPLLSPTRPHELHGLC